MTKYPPYFIEALNAWKISAKKLGFVIHAPYTLRYDQLSADCLAYLEHFGTQNGIVVGWTIPPHFETDGNLIACAEMCGMFYSFLDLKAYSQYEERLFKETLSDWGYFGPPEKRPSWCL